MTAAKQRLLAEAIEYLATNGVSDLSLRQLATALGTSHRMLIYHFGSKEGLLIEVVRAMERRQREIFVALDLNPDLNPEINPEMPPPEIARRFWQQLADPSMWPYERLFFELYGRALQGDPGAAPLLEGIVERWLAPLTEWRCRQGAPPQSAAADARLGLAVARGLLLDLLTTGDHEAVDAAMERFIALALINHPATETSRGKGGLQEPEMSPCRARRGRDG